MFYEPTVIKNANDEMLVSYEETFGPVAPLFSFSTEKEVIERANNTPFGLASYFYTRDLAKSWRVSEQLEYGIVNLFRGYIGYSLFSKWLIGNGAKKIFSVRPCGTQPLSRGTA